jgi:hypothetical protein
MAHAQAVQTVVADPGLEVDADICLVATGARLAHPLAREPLADGESADEVLAGLEASPRLLDVGEGCLLVTDFLQHGGDEDRALGIIGFREAEESADVIEVRLGGFE